MLKQTIIRPLLAILFAAQGAIALAGEENIHLKEAPGRDTVMAYCTMCHSADVIQMNSPFLKRAQWEATVQKMRKAMHAPIPDDQVATIVDYLAKNYGVAD